MNYLKYLTSFNFSYPFQVPPSTHLVANIQHVEKNLSGYNIWGNLSIHILYDLFKTMLLFQKDRVSLHKYFSAGQNAITEKASNQDQVDPCNPYFLAHFVFAPANKITDLLVQHVMEREQGHRKAQGSLQHGAQKKMQLEIRRTIIREYLNVISLFGLKPDMTGSAQHKEFANIIACSKASMDQYVRSKGKWEENRHLEIVGATQIILLLIPSVISKQIHYESNNPDLVRRDIDMLRKPRTDDELPRLLFDSKQTSFYVQCTLHSLTSPFQNFLYFYVKL